MIWTGASDHRYATPIRHSSGNARRTTALSRKTTFRLSQKKKLKQAVPVDVTGRPLLEHAEHHRPPQQQDDVQGHMGNQPTDRALAPRTTSRNQHTQVHPGTNGLTRHISRMC